MITSTLVKSSAIRTIGYSQFNTLYIVFNSGLGYRYYDVPREVYEELINSESIGKAYNRLIRGQYEGKRMSQGHTFTIVNLSLPVRDEYLTV